ncbi:MAG: Crp/Fnr family transcriptional regulator [Proteobacteria bacterium]|nr:Crp/Fnr family transcriptional regulator [Pseudomonadota bacterium]
MANQPLFVAGPNCFTCQARERTEWCVLQDAELRLIEDGKKSRRYLPGETIFREGDTPDGIFCIESGMIGLRKSDAEGNTVLLNLLSEGETLGYRAFLADSEYDASAEALEPSTACFVDRPTIRRLLEHNPALGLRFLKRVAKDLGDADEKILHNVSLSVRARFAHLLMVFVERYGKLADNGSSSIDLPLSRQDMASMIGTTPESMSRTIKKMETDGIARFSGRTVQIPSCRNLVNEFDPEVFV